MSALCYFKEKKIEVGAFNQVTVLNKFTISMVEELLDKLYKSHMYSED